MHIRSYLDKHQLSQGEFARRVGVTQGAVWQWLNGLEVSAKAAVKIEDATKGEINRADLRPDLWKKRNGHSR